MSFEITSEAFGEGESIPVRYTCDGENLSPALAWGEPPDGTESLVLIMDDPDAPAGTWVHWVLFNLPPGQGWLEEGVAAEAESSDGSRHGSNSWGQLGYGGPCPPSGTHRYFFHLYALDSDLDLDPGSTKEQVLAEAEPHVLGQTELLGTFAR
jgi:Raf kinase inhibitor-like YbhB/YbcL family protein